MKSVWPALLGIVGLVGGAFCFDAHCERVADAASTWVAPPASTTPIPATQPTNDTPTKTSVESTVALGSKNESK